jgi:hypothetical protein
MPNIDGPQSRWRFSRDSAIIKGALDEWVLVAA